MKSSFSFSERKSGSAFITVILFTFMLSVLIGSIIGWSRNERLLTVRNAHWLEARNAAEALAEYGFAQVSNQFNGHSSAPKFDPGVGTSTGNYPIEMPPGSPANADGTTTTGTSYWDQNGHVYLSTSAAYKMDLVASTSQSLPASGFYYVDPTVVNNQTDPLKGQYIKRNDVTVLAKASVLSPEGGPPVTAYVEEVISARGAPLFANAIFYSNVDLEIFPGPTMTITGPVRCNGNVYVSSQGSSLTFAGPVSLSGSVYHAWANSAGASEGSGSEALGSSPVYFINSANAEMPMSENVGVVNGTTYNTIWVDSTMGADVAGSVSGLSNLQALTTSNAKLTSDFRQEATQLWGGNLQTGAMGVQVNNPISFSQVIDSAGDTPDPHSIIDPPGSTAYVQDTADAGSPYANARASVETQKFSTQAGVYVQVTVNPAGLDGNGNPVGPPTATIAIYGPPGSTEGTTTTLGPNNGPLVASVVGSTSNGLIKFLPYQSKTVGTSTQVSTTYVGTGSNHYTKTVTTGVYPTAQSNYSTGEATTVVTSTVATSSSSTTTSITSSTVPTNTVATTSSTMGSTTSASATTISDGLFDQRRQMGIDLVQIDMSVLTKVVNDMSNNSNTDNMAFTYNNGTATPAVWGQTTGTGAIGGTSGTPWNGGIYVDVEAPSQQTSSQSASVILVNGTVASGSSMIPSFGANTNGLTIATNAPVYIQGNFNADGTVNSSSPTTPDDGNNDTGSTSSAESPACVAADAVTVLSTGFSTNGSLTKSPAETGTVEIAAALLTGIVTTSNGASSGGAHNLPRFLESWSNAVAIRGSLTCLYSSKVATQPWSTAYYGAPPRQWGFDNQFKNGHYPPLVPKVMSYRRVLFKDLSAAAYTSAKHLMYPTEY